MLPRDEPARGRAILVLVLVVFGMVVVDTIAERMGGDDGLLELGLTAGAAAAVGLGIVLWRAVRRRSGPPRGIMHS
jgi:hypothetical protein